VLLFDERQAGLRDRRLDAGKAVGRQSARRASVTPVGTEFIAFTCRRRSSGHDNAGPFTPVGRVEPFIRDLPAFDRRVRLVWSKRRFSCPDPDCPVQTWTERSDELPDRRVLSARAGRECTCEC
jgi:hypothetical protein